jgi:2',3'-cyclic-nucleotide 2'-phosphodiesterase (5'-nucleotidase family)
MKNFLVLLSLLFFASCDKHFVPITYQFEEKRITAQDPRDVQLWDKIQPYKDSLDKEMNIVLAVSDTILTKSIPESDLGNFMCDLILKKSRDYYGQYIDFTFLNNGGIRLPNLPKGNITLGNIIELMPFENRLGVIQVKGIILDTLFDYMASKGGWQVSNARYKIKDSKAIEVEIADAPLSLDKTYTVVASDYLLQGGDNCDMLKNIPYLDLKKTLRDALVEGLIEMNQRNEHVRSVLDGRVSKVK